MPSLFIPILFLWSIFWKGVALWRAAKNRELKWFIALLVINTAGILDIVYLFYFSKEKLTFEELKSWYKGKFNR